MNIQKFNAGQVESRSGLGSFKLALLCLLLFSISLTSFGRKIYSSGSGNWTNTGTWVGGVVPVANDTVIIQNTHSVAVTGNLYNNSTYMFLIILGTLDLTENGKMSFNASSKVIIETGAQILGNGSQDQISIGTGPSEYSGGLGTISGPSYVSNGHTPASGEGTAGCGCYTSVGSCTITSTNGYQVHINVWATQIDVQNFPCPWGYTYQVRLNYNVSFSGSNIPSNLYTLQGTVYCGATSLTFGLPLNGGAGTVNTATASTLATNCDTVTPEMLSCLNATMLVEGPGISNGTTCTTTLPITLLKFEAEPSAHGAHLFWITSMERDFDYFQIERAQQDLNFISIAEIKGKGGMDINTSYDYVDQEVQRGKNYYRLKSVDLDGSFEYSKVVYVNWNNGSGVRVYPNPLTGNSFTVELNDELTTPTEIQLLNQLGNIVYQSELVKPTTSVQLPNTIRPGIYHLKLSGGQEMEIIKIAIQ